MGAHSNYLTLDGDMFTAILIARATEPKPNKIFLRKHTIAKEDGNKLSWEARPNGLMKANARKIKVDILGRVFDPLAKDNDDGGTDC